MAQYVAFVTAEDEDDLVVSFALDEHAYASLTLTRTPRGEAMLPDEERGVTLSSGAKTNGGPELLLSLIWGAATVKMTGTAHEYNLDISAIDADEVEDAKRVLLKMNFDKRFELTML